MRGTGAILTAPYWELFDAARAMYCAIGAKNDRHSAIIYVSHAKYFLPSFGGFSAVVSNVARMNGAQIIRLVDD